MAKSLVHQIIRGLSYIHSRGIAHRDIKLENIIVKTEVVVGGAVYKPVIVDFGLSKLFLTNERSTQSYGSLLFSSPEILLKGHSHTVMTDMWSLGVLLHVLLSGIFPFTGNN